MDHAYIDEQQVAERLAALLAAAGALTVALPARLLAPGDFTVQVEEMPRQGEPVPAGDLAFRVVPGR